MTKFSYVLVALLSIATAHEVSADSYDLAPDGVQLELSDDGSLFKIYSLVRQPVTIADSRGILKAQTIAEEKAKANFVRFIDENVTTKRTVREKITEIENASSRLANYNAAQTEHVVQRRLQEEVEEIISSQSSGTVNGVVVLERGYSREEKIAWVKVGISQKSINAARDLSSMLNGPIDGEDLESTEATSSRSKYKGEF